MFKNKLNKLNKLNIDERLLILEKTNKLASSEIELLKRQNALSIEQADNFIENCVSTFALPLGLATNFVINEKELLIPMAIEESSVVAAASFAAKLALSGGGFTTVLAEPIATCQIEIFTFVENIEFLFKQNENHLIEIANLCHPRLLERGGGVKKIDLRKISENRFVIHLYVDTREAMGANIVNTIAETVGSRLNDFIPCRVGLKILTNLTLERITKANCEILPEFLAMNGFTGEETINRIISAYDFANLDIFRATTHNKGIMNGIDPVVIATGNDWRAVEAACHAYASLSGRYKPLSKWFKNDKGHLCGEIEVPIAVGTIGGVTKLHKLSQIALKLLDNPSSAQLSGIIASVGLAQNLSALRALACEGIQKGHMALHKKNIELLKKSLKG